MRTIEIISKLWGTNLLQLMGKVTEWKLDKQYKRQEMFTAK